MSGKSHATLILLPEAYDALHFCWVVLYGFYSQDIQNPDHDFSRSRLKIYALDRDCVNCLYTTCTINTMVSFPHNKHITKLQVIYMCCIAWEMLQNLAVENGFISQRSRGRSRIYIDETEIIVWCCNSILDRLKALLSCATAAPAMRNY